MKRMPTITFSNPSKEQKAFFEKAQREKKERMRKLCETYKATGML